MQTKGKDPKKGKQDEKLLALINARKSPMHQASRLEGAVRNTGIKNLGAQKKKGSRGDK